jgi:hypothetical protein
MRGSAVQIVYEAHLRAVMIERAGMSRGATEMTLQALVRLSLPDALRNRPPRANPACLSPAQFSILTEKCEEGCLDGLALDFGIIALRRRL